MVTNMSMNVTCCKLLAFRASLTTVYWYLRKSMCVTHVSVLVPYGSRCTSVKYKYWYWYLRKSMNETHCKRIGTLWKQFRTVSPQPLAAMSKLFVTLFLLGPKAQIRWSCVIGRKLLTTTYWHVMEVVLMEATQGIPAPGLDPVGCFKGKHLKSRIHYQKENKTFIGQINQQYRKNRKRCLNIFQLHPTNTYLHTSQYG